jgi:hypothetical protein
MPTTVAVLGTPLTTGRLAVLAKPPVQVTDKSIAPFNVATAAGVPPVMTLPICKLPGSAALVKVQAKAVPRTSAAGTV